MEHSDKMDAVSRGTIHGISGYIGYISIKMFEPDSRFRI